MVNIKIIRLAIFSSQVRNTVSRDLGAFSHRKAFLAARTLGVQQGDKDLSGSSETLERSVSRLAHLSPPALQKSRALCVAIPLEDRHHKDKAIELTKLRDITKQRV
jgi:hypothetical protein